MKNFLSLRALVLLLGLSFCLQGCAVYSTATDERLMDTMASDTGITTSLKKDLMAEKMSDGWSISVYSYYGHVFLVGEAPQKMREKAVAIARKNKNVRTVTPHWFGRRDGDSDFVLRTKLRTALIGTSNLNSTRIDTAVNSNRVVLLGVATNEEERKTAIQAAREVSGVETVTSYLMLPPRDGEKTEPKGVIYKGLNYKPGKDKAKEKAKPEEEKPDGGVSLN